jgi:hypothetical protein
VITYTSATPPVFSNSPSLISSLLGSGRSETEQGGYQMIGWLISIGCGLFAGVVIGFIYRLLNDSFE